MSWKLIKFHILCLEKKTSLLLIRLNSLTKIVETYNHQNDEDAGENHQNEATENYSNHNPDIHAGVWIWKYNKVSKQPSHCTQL